MKRSAVIIALMLYNIINASAQNEMLSYSLAYNKSADKTEIILSAEIRNSDGNFISYIKGAQDEISGNEKRIAALRSKLLDSNKKSIKSAKLYKKREKNISILEIYNNELKTDLSNYLSYGTGDWKLFKKEFNRELEELARDINELKHEYEDFIAAIVK